MVGGSRIYRDADTSSGLTHAIDVASSKRYELWVIAVEPPPENIWFGSGMGNIPNSVLTVHRRTTRQLGHLHNFLLDCWYETGFVGLALLLAWIGSSTLAGLQNWTRSMDTDAAYRGTLLAACMAILANALFSYSYSSKQFACYLFMYLCLGRLVPTAGQDVAPATRPQSTSSVSGRTGVDALRR